MSSTFSSCSSSKFWKYDVFLSFRGQDTRRNFVSHLYYALQQRGIRVFKDDERLKTGKSISDELLKAIEDSRSAIVVFSSSYAASRWCLEELAHIIKCKNELDQIVIPIFYDVSPSDVRNHQNPPFAESFFKHEVKYRDDLEKMQSWRDAFEQAGKLSGYHLQNFSNEADCIKKIVDCILAKSPQVVSRSAESLVGMRSQVEEVISLLDMRSNDNVRFVGIWGMGGIGTTKIAMVIFEKISSRFEGACFLDVGEGLKDNGLPRSLLSDLFGEDVIVTSFDTGMKMISRRLHMKKLFIVLDNVDCEEQLKFLAGVRAWFGEGSRILITTRHKRLVTTHMDEEYEVRLLPLYEALALFCRHAFRSDQSPEKGFKKLTRQVVKYADGLPLALEVLGSSLYQRDEEEWRDIMARLKKIPHNDSRKA